MLPNNITITGKDYDKALSAETRERIGEELVDYLTEKYGYCVNGFGYDIKIEIDQIDWDTED